VLLWECCYFRELHLWDEERPLHQNFIIVMSRKQKKRLALFHFGAQAAARYRDGDSSLYFCPICKAGFPKSAAETGLITLEHVPPERIGGKELLLTCSRCNATAGHTVDAALDRRTLIKEFSETIGGKGNHHLRRVLLGMGGLQLTTELSRSDETINIKVIQKANNPQVIKDASEPGLLSDGDEIKLSMSIKTYEHAKLSDLKSAFLLVTALFGYKYAFDPLLDKVREQIRNPDKDLLGMRYKIDFPEGTLPSQSILRVIKPTYFYFVVFQHYGIVLPSLDSPFDLNNILNQQQEQEGQFAVKWDWRFQWPHRLMMIFDFD